MGRRKLSVSKVVQLGMLTAIQVVAMLVCIPLGAHGAAVHFGGAALFTCALLFGPAWAGATGVLGALLHSLMMGLTPYSPLTVLVFGAAGGLCGLLSHTGAAGGRRLGRNLLATLAGSVLLCAGYFLSFFWVQGSVAAALPLLPGTLFTCAAGVALALPLAALLHGALEKAGFISPSQEQKGSRMRL